MIWFFMCYYFCCHGWWDVSFEFCFTKLIPCESSFGLCNLWLFTCFEVNCGVIFLRNIFVGNLSCVNMVNNGCECDPLPFGIICFFFLPSSSFFRCFWFDFLVLCDHHFFLLFYVNTIIVARIMFFKFGDCDWRIQMPFEPWFGCLHNNYLVWS